MKFSLKFVLGLKFSFGHLNSVDRSLIGGAILYTTLARTKAPLHIKLKDPNPDSRAPGASRRLSFSFASAA